MRYQAYLNNNIFYDSQADMDELALTSATVKLTAGASGSFEFTVPRANTRWNQFSKFAFVDVYRDGECIFSGRVYEVTEDMYLNHNVTCEGLLAILNDTVLAPADYNNVTLDYLIGQVISSHNSQAGSSKQITKGNIEISDGNLTRQYVKYESSMTRLLDLVDSYGGYLRLRLEDGIKYLDWLQQSYGTAKQAIEFGQNMLDITQESGIDDIITVLWPFGAEVEDPETHAKSRVNISSVNSGVLYIEDQAAVTNFGRVAQAVYFDDITVPSNLKARATEYLNEHKQSKVTIRLSAVDMSLIESSTDRFRIGESITVNSSLHGLSNSLFTCVSMSLNLLNPGSDSLTLSQKDNGYIGQQRKAKKETEKSISSVSSAVNDADARIDEIAGDVDELGEAVETKVSLTSDEWSVVTGYVNGAKAYMTFDAEKGLCIGRNDSNIHSEQDNDEYKFVDKNGNELLKIDTDGTHSKMVEVKGQIMYSEGSTTEWATRQGDSVANVGHNLDDVWVG